MRIQSFDPRNYSLNGPGEAPGSHQSSSTARGRRSNRTRDDTHSHPSTGQRSSENESSEQASPPPQIPRTPVIRPLRQTIPGWKLSDPIPIPSRRPTDGSSSQPPQFPFFSETSWEDYVSDDTVANYRAIGAQYQAWIAGPTTTACPIRRSRVTWTDLVNHPLEDYSFEVYLNETRSTPEEVGNIESAGLSMGNNWRYVFLRQYGSWDGGRQEGYTVYQHRTGLGAIFVENITRRFGPYWAQVAQAQYQLDNHIDTLRYVYFINVQNLYTWPYVECHLYPRHGLHWFDDYKPQCWTYGTREYQELLGTKLGRGVARLVLGAWPRGTHRIDTIYTWTFIGNLQMRFDIKQI
ncbi:hypothetical protein N7471_003883 [Penicillium samsonianum]|uniref:uncharacterized protein n=1 Tax=Penicillium samsonianum TaxID=1882272 RepID=UPI0025467D14|nr:uncharacterized protein N7471_003883 [Penicillium samsonianum]KAJ6137397.1 hypothetical protein N7471_003883 [Penicillium samsonianum]